MWYIIAHAWLTLVWFFVSHTNKKKHFLYRFINDLATYEAFIMTVFAST